MLSKNNVCVIAHPYVVNLDGLPKLDFIYNDFKKPRYKPPVSEYGTFEKYVRMNRKEQRACLTEIGQTKRRRSIPKSESIEKKHK